MIPEFESLLTWGGTLLRWCGQAFPPNRVIEPIIDVQKGLKLTVGDGITCQPEGRFDERLQQRMAKTGQRPLAHLIGIGPAADNGSGKKRRVVLTDGNTRGA